MRGDRRLILTGFLFSISLGGCAHPVAPIVDVTGMPNAEIAMRRSMAHVDKEMSELGRLQPFHAGAPAVVPAELDKVVAFEWEGPIEGAVEKLAKEVGYDVVVDAPFNAPSVSIGISAGPQRVYRIFEAIGGAAGNRATVKLDPQHHLVQVIYHV